MPSKKKKYNARFPPARIKKIMQRDEEVGKVAAPVPVIISRALELFVESLIRQSSQVTIQKNARTLTTSHLKQCILAETKFDFLKDLVASVPDFQGEDEAGNSLPCTPTATPSMDPFNNGRRTTKGPRRTGGASPGPSRTDTDSESSSGDEDEEEDADEDDEEEVGGHAPIRLGQVPGTSITHPHIVFGGNHVSVPRVPTATMVINLDEDYDT